MSDVAQIRALFLRLDQEFGRIDFLGNVAGEGMLAAPEDIAIETVQKIMQNLVIGRFAACQEAGRRMLAQGRGSIVNIGSLASLTALGRGHIAYSMAMGAVVQMTRELSTEWSGRGVRVNAILPAQVMNKGLAQRHRGASRTGADVPARHSRRPPGRARRHPGPGRAPGLRCLVLDHRHADPHGRRQPGEECGRLPSGDAWRRVGNLELEGRRRAQTMPTLSVVELRTFTLDILEKLGTPADFAHIVCDNLVGANLVGHDSHGVLRLTTYTQFVREGAVIPAAVPVVVRREGATAHVDGHWGWGAVGARLGAETALALAAAYGIGAVTVNRCTHIGRIGEYVALLAEAGMVGIALCNSGPGVAPFGGRERIFGTNPFAFAAPGGRD